MSITPTIQASLVSAFACALLVTPADDAIGQNAVAPVNIEQDRVLEMEGMSAWLQARFSQAELEGLRPGELKIEAHYCGCYDHPRKHFPYAAVLLRTPRGDLIARPEGSDQIVRFTALAVRFGNRYCELDSEQTCFGTFFSVCDFTDFRYGPHLSAYFPSCKADETETAASIALERLNFGP